MGGNVHLPTPDSGALAASSRLTRVLGDGMPVARHNDMLSR